MNLDTFVPILVGFSVGFVAAKAANSGRIWLATLILGIFALILAAGLIYTLLLLLYG